MWHLIQRTGVDAKLTVEPRNAKMTKMFAKTMNVVVARYVLKVKMAKLNVSAIRMSAEPAIIIQDAMLPQFLMTVDVPCNAISHAQLVMIWIVRKQA
jgi:hypothetical protein